MTSWWRHHRIYGALITEGNFISLSLGGILTPLESEIKWSNICTDELWNMTAWWRHHSLSGSLVLEKVVCLQLYNSIISHPILMKLNRIDHTLIEINPSRYVDVITPLPLHWFWTKKAWLSLWIAILQPCLKTAFNGNTKRSYNAMWLPRGCAVPNNGSG